MAQKKPDNTTFTPRITNRQARHEYEILDKLEVGIVLTGSEVKSVRAGQVNLADGFARIEPGDMGLYLYNVDIAVYKHASLAASHEPKRRRKLLAHKPQIRKLLAQTAQKGLTLVPLAMYFSRQKVKVELGLVRGKKAFDKRQSLKSREADRQIRRGLAKRVL